MLSAGRHLHAPRLHPAVLSAAERHRARGELAGRVFKNVPAPYNLPVPPYTFVNDMTIRVGENPANVSFDFSSIRQL
jgi:hypothetical protein